MLKFRPTFAGGKRTTTRRTNAQKQAPEGPVIPYVGSFSQCGKKHIDNEDRVLTSDFSVSLGSDALETFTFSDMLSLHPDEVVVEDVLFTSIFDGHGGSGCANFVSKNLHNRIAKAMTKKARRFEDLASTVIDGFKECSDDFALLGQLNEDNSGCCALVVLIYHEKMLISWAGDCRAVFYDGMRSEQLTADHRGTNPDEFKRVAEHGGVLTSGNRVSGVLVPTRCFGDLDVRAANPEGVLISEPAVVTKTLSDSDANRKHTCFLILATDGVWDVLSSETACEIVAKALKSNGNNADLAAAKLVEEASRKSLDDLTVSIVIWNTVPWEIYSGIVRESGYSNNSDEGEKY